MKKILIPIFSLLLGGAGCGVAGVADNASAKIDRLVQKGLEAQKLEANRPIGDEVFVRRIYLDIAGRIPTRRESEAFLQSKERNKRDLLIDELLRSDGYVSHFYHFWADLLRARTAINGNNLGSGTGRAYEGWIKKSLRENKPYDEMARELITATGHSWENGAVGYYIRDYGMPLDNAAMTAQVFLGTQIVCAQCHNHPFDKWTQMDYYHLAAFTYGMTTTNQLPGGMREVQRAIKNLPRELGADKQRELRRAFSEILKPVRFNNVVETDRLPKLPHDYQYDDAKPKSVVRPASVMGPEAVISPSESHAEAFAAWITSPENPRFTLVMANRLWKKAFGLGVIEPVDNMKDHSVASNPELLAYLERLFRGLDYDMKAYLGAIFKSESYQREVSLEEVAMGAPYYFPGPILRRMTAEQVWDSVVAMVRENPDAPDPEWELEGKEALLRRQLIGESVYDQEPNRFVRNGLEILRVQKELSEKIDAAVAKLGEAREDGDLEKIREASQEVRQVRRELAQQVERQVYLEGLKDKVETVSAGSDGNPAADAFFEELVSTIEKKGDGDMTAGMNAVIDDDGGFVVKLVRAMMADERHALHEERVARAGREMKEWSVPAKGQRKKAYLTFSKMRDGMVRASELPSPAPVGHFLREFGQSDRELIDNANDQASVTQALTLLNGNISFAVSNPYSVFSRDTRTKNFEERLEHVYQVMFSRSPSEHEVSVFKEAFRADPEASSISSIAWTLLNTRQFLFIN